MPSIQEVTSDARTPHLTASIIIIEQSETPISVPFIPIFTHNVKFFSLPKNFPLKNRLLAPDRRTLGRHRLHGALYSKLPGSRKIMIADEEANNVLLTAIHLTNQTTIFPTI